MMLKCCWPRKSTGQAPTGEDNTKVHANVEVGLKFLYSGASPIVDIVAVHGLGGHREESWTASNGVNWLQSLLPADIRESRVYTWGYDGSPKSDRQVSMEMLSESLVHDLYQMRKETNTDDRPMIFVAHSLGGNLVKSALVYSATDPETNDSLCHHVIFQSTIGVFSIDATELGPFTDGMKTYLASTKDASLKDTEAYREAQWTIETLERYCILAGNIRTIYVSTEPKIRELQMRGDRGLCSYITINTSHGDMCKFESASNDRYKEIKETMIDMIENATSANEREP